MVGILQEKVITGMYLDLDTSKTCVRNPRSNCSFKYSGVTAGQRVDIKYLHKFENRVDALGGMTIRFNDTCWKLFDVLHICINNKDYIMREVLHMDMRSVLGVEYWNDDILLHAFSQSELGVLKRLSHGRRIKRLSLSKMHLLNNRSENECKSIPHMYEDTEYFSWDAFEYDNLFIGYNILCACRNFRSTIASYILDAYAGANFRIYISDDKKRLFAACTGASYVMFDITADFETYLAKDLMLRGGKRESI